MRAPRFSIAVLMGAVLVISIGLAALRARSETWAGVMFLLTCGVLALAAVGVVSCDKGSRAWWAGFALFGYGYLRLAFWSHEHLPILPTTIVLEALDERLTEFVSIDNGAAMPRGFCCLLPVTPLGSQNLASGLGEQSLIKTGHCLLSLVAAALGGILALALFTSRWAEPPLPTSDRPESGSWPRTTPPRPAVIASCGVALVILVAIAGCLVRPALAGGAAYLLTWVLLGAAALGAVYGAGRQRAIWFGATLFGAGYLILHLGWPPHQKAVRTYVLTDQFLSALRPGGSAEPPPNVSAANARIHNALEQPISMSFPNETPLEDVLKCIRIATQGPNDTGIPIYLDPAGLEDAGKTTTSPVQLDLEGVPLKTTLRLALKPLGLVYKVEDGVLLITSVAGDHYVIIGDPFLLVGHCVLALLAAGIGAIAADRICRPGRMTVSAT